MINVMIAEDEKLAREELEFLLMQEPDFAILPSARNGKELLNLAEQYEPDVIFMDIRMPELEGIAAASFLSLKEHCPLFVFCTAYDKFALKAFGLNAVDYLLKPYDIFRLKETLKRVRGRLKQHLHEQHLAMKTLTDSKIHDKILLEEGVNYILLDEKEIVYAEKAEKMVNIHTMDRVIKSKMSLQQLEELLDDEMFYRPHRSYLVNLSFISELRPWFNGAYNMILKNEPNSTIPVPRTTIKVLLKKLKKE